MWMPAVATVIAQGLSVLLCMIRMVKDGGAATIHFKELRFNGSMIRQVITQGLPTGLQNSVISVGNLVVQSNINTFGAFAISGQGAFAKLEGIAFLPIMSMSMALTTFVSQNLGAGKADRAKKGSVIGCKAVLDSRKVKEWGLNPKVLPFDVQLINQPVSFYQQYTYQIWSACALFVILVLGLCISLSLKKK